MYPTHSTDCDSYILPLWQPEVAPHASWRSAASGQPSLDGVQLPISTPLADDRIDVDSTSLSAVTTTEQRLEPTPLAPQGWSGDYAYQGLVLVILALWVRLLVRFQGVVMLLPMVVGSGFSQSAHYRKEHTYIKAFNRSASFLSSLLWCGLLLRTLAAMGEYPSLSEVMFPSLWVVAGWLGVFAVMYYRYAVVRGVCDFLQVPTFFKSFFYADRLKRSMITWIALPLYLCVALYGGVLDSALLLLLWGVIVGLHAMRLYFTLRLFLESGLSILQWFLYLCIVEIFPISLIVLILKNLVL